VINLQSYFVLGGKKNHRPYC